MQRRLRFLSIVLAAAAAALIAAAMPLLVQSAPPQQIQYTKTTHVDLPGVLKMFMHNAGNSSERVTVGQTRSRTDSGDTSRIVQCDLKRIISLDNKAKTYYIETFDEMMNSVTAQMKAAQAQMRAASPNPAASPVQIKGSGTMTFSVSEVPDDQTQTILGMTAHHVVSTWTMTSKGTGDCPSGTMAMKTDEWYIPNEIAMQCPLPIPKMPPSGMPQGAGGPQQSNPCMQNFSLEANMRKHTSSDRFALRETMETLVNGKSAGFATHEDVTEYQKAPYDPSFFDVPAGYTQVQPPTQGQH